MGQITTSTMFSELKKDGTFVKFAKEHEETFLNQSFAEYLFALSKEKEVAPASVVRNAQIDRVYGQQLFSGIRKPSRDKAIQLAFGFALSLDETQRLLQMADKSRLYPRIKRDAAIVYGLEHRMKLQELQELLYAIGVPVLGESNTSPKEEENEI